MGALTADEIYERMVKGLPAAEKVRLVEKIESDLGANQRILTDRESKLEVLKQLNEEGAGLGAGTQAVLKGLNNPQLYRAAIIGALANFIEVNNEYLAAIEAALGYHLQAVLVREHLV